MYVHIYYVFYFSYFCLLKKQVTPLIFYCSKYFSTFSALFLSSLTFMNGIKLLTMCDAVVQKYIYLTNVYFKKRTTKIEIASRERERDNLFLKYSYREKVSIHAKRITVNGYFFR